MGFEPGDHISKAYALAKLASGVQVAGGQALSNVDMNVQTPGMVGQVLTLAGITPTYVDAEDEPAAGGFGLGSGRLNPIGTGIDGKPFYSYAESNAPPIAGFHVHPDWQSMMDDLKSKSPILNELTKDLHTSGNDYRLRPGVLTYAKPAGTGCEGYFSGGCASVIDPEKIYNFQYPIAPESRTAGSDRAQMTLQRAIVHELVHAWRHQIDPGWDYADQSNQNHGTIVDMENMIMNQIDPSSPNRDPHDLRLIPNKR